MFNQVFVAERGASWPRPYARPVLARDYRRSRQNTAARAIVPSAALLAQKLRQMAAAKMLEPFEDSKATVVPRPEVPRLEVPGLSDKAAVVQLEVMMRPMEFCASAR